jgi:hypothetical protein
VAAVAAELGPELAGQVPGFVLNRQGRLDLVCGDAELLIPVRDVDGRIGGIRRRLDDPGEGNKYKWLSAPKGEHSSGIDGHTVHVAQPAHLRTDRALIIEGEIKANITADHFGCVVLSVPGVSNINRVTATLAELGAKDVAIAYDKDTKPRTIEGVAAAETKLAHRLIDAGYHVAQWTWGAEEAKGIDDLLTAGLWPFPIPHPALTAQREDDETPNANAARVIEQLRAERDSARLVNQARARIQRNTRLPARPMATVVTGVFAQAATASAPAGDYQGRVPAGFVAVPVRELSIDAGTKEGNAGKQLKDLEVAGLIRRKSLKEIRPAGQVDPETGEMANTPRVYSKHFIAIAGHEHEPITADLVRGLVDRMATYDHGTPERRGGKRIPRCKDHPDAPVHRHWTARCSVCDAELDGDIDVIPAMHLEPLEAHDQTLITREDAPAPSTQPTPLVIRDSLGTRSIAHEVRQRAAAAVDQSLVVRRQRAYADLSGLAQWAPDDAADDQAVIEDDAGEPPPLTLFVLPDAGCEGCGAATAEGCRYCPACDPRTA